jgi:hypothetical protein
MQRRKRGARLNARTSTSCRNAVPLESPCLAVYGRRIFETGRWDALERLAGVLVPLLIIV